MYRQILFFLLTMAATAQIEAPRVGYVMDSRGALRTVNGLAGAFVVGPPTVTDVISAAYSGRTLVVKKASELLVDGASFKAPSGPIEVRFDARGGLSEVFFPEAHLLWIWRSGKFDELTSTRPYWSNHTIRDNEVVIDDAAIRFPSRVRSISQLGEKWFVVYAESGTYAVRNAQIFELPEGVE